MSTSILFVCQYEVKVHVHLSLFVSTVVNFMNIPTLCTLGTRPIVEKLSETTKTIGVAIELSFMFWG